MNELTFKVGTITDMMKRFAIVRVMKRYPNTRFHKAFTRFSNMIVTQKEYERLYGYDAIRIMYESDDYNKCLLLYTKWKDESKELSDKQKDRGTLHDRQSARQQVLNSKKSE